MAENHSDPLETYHLDEQAGYLLRLANQRHTMIFQENTLYGLTATQFAALMRVSERGACSQNHLGRLAAMDVATIKGVVDRLNQKGLTETQQDPTDKRRMLISLSPKGQKVVEEMKDVGRRITRETLSPLTAAEQRNLKKILRKIV
ncbi:MAG: MarR family winged helix-turn-helix transcriptional regulator [Paracoccaceae bacterium]